jgi:hypothetical protein
MKSMNPREPKDTFNSKEDKEARSCHSLLHS